MPPSSVAEILDLAISQEEYAARFYTHLASVAAGEHMKDVFLSFAREEEGHKAKLLQVKAGKQVLCAEQRVADLKIGDYLVDVAASDQLDYQDSLILAMKVEKAAFRMYQELAAVTDDPALKEMLLGLAQEEAKHKLRFEIEYDDRFLKEN